MIAKRYGEIIIMVMGFFLIVLIVLIVSIGCTTDVRVNDGTIDSKVEENGISSTSMFSEENYQELEELFQSMDEEIKGLVSALSGDGFLMDSGGISIRFINDVEFNSFAAVRDGQVGIRDGKIIESYTDELAEAIERNTELMSFIELIDKRGVMWGVSYSIDSIYEETWRVRFHIRPEYVSFIGTDLQDDIRSYFLFQEGTRRIQRTREIEEGWYIHIETRD
jgi:hypothetical protein